MILSQAGELKEVGITGGRRPPRQEVRGSGGLGPNPPVGYRDSTLLGFQGAKAPGAKQI